MAMLRPSASLYCGNLSPEVTEANLYDIFNQVGPVASIRVCRDAATRRSLGYGYVNFHNAVDAERALDTLNYQDVKGRPCRIMWSQRDPALRRSGVGNIFIKNLDKSIDNKALHDTFSAFGNILSCKVMTDEADGSRGFGFVHFETAESAESAISKINGMLLNDKKVYVGHHVSRKERHSKYEELKKNFTNVFVKNLDESVEDQGLADMFKEFGTISSAVVMKDDNGKSKGFGFVNFDSHEEAVAACDDLNEKEVNSKKLFVGRAQKKSERREELQKKYEAMKQERLNKYQGINLFVKNLDDDINDEKLRDEFSAFGTITSAKVQVDEKNNSKGFGFVCFSSPEEATKAVTEMNGKMLGSKPIYVALAQRRETRRQQLEVQYSQRAQIRMAQQSGVLGGPMYGQPFFFGMAQPPPRGGQQGGFVYPGAGMYRPPRWNNGQQGAPNGQQAEMMAGPGGSFPGPAAAGGVRPNRGPASGGGRSRPGQQPGQGAQPGQGQGQQGGQQAQAGPGQQPRKNYRYTGNVRNQRVEQNAPQQLAQAPAAAAMPPMMQEPLTASALASMPDDQQKNVIGERLYMIIAQKEPELAGKITGMLLDMDNSELLHLLDSNQALQEKVDEALEVLHEHEANEG